MQADFSQLQAIGAARTGRNIVIHGPPGTGKSQTIANLIGAFLADGKSVLFVSEKTAALDVVKRRLASSGLGTFCLDLHSERGRKANVYLQFGESLANATDTGGTDPDYSALLDSRSRLNEYVRAIHEKRSPLGLTAYQVAGLFAHVRELPDVDFPVPNVRNLSQDTLASFTDLGRRIAARRPQFEEHFTSKWLPLRETTPGVGLPDVIRRRLDGLLEVLMEADRSCDEIAYWMGLEPAHTAISVERQAGLLALMETCPQIEASWLTDGAVNRLKEIAAQQAEFQDQRARDLASFDVLFSARPQALNYFEICCEHREAGLHRCSCHSVLAGTRLVESRVRRTSCAR